MEETKIEIDGLTDENGCMMFERLGKGFIIIPKPMPSQKELSDYVNINIFEFSEGETILEIENVEYLEDVYSLISKRIIEGKSITRILNDVSSLFLRTRSKLEKFRGDYAEAAYLAFVGGKWVPNNDIYDIEHDGKYIEVKSFSPQQKSVIISIEQLRSNTTKVAYPLRASDNGYTISELSELIKNDNPDFAAYLDETYKGDKQAEKKYEKFDFENITDQLNFNSVLPDTIESGKLKVKITLQNKNI